MSASTESMYQEIILDHYRHPQHHGLSDPFDAEIHHVNPTCGDEVTLRVRLDGPELAEVTWEGEGCSISQASTSIMTDLVTGRSVTDALALQSDFLELMRSRGQVTLDEDALDRLDDAIAFAGVAKYPARVKCALLGWMAMKGAVAQATGSTAQATGSTAQATGSTAQATGSTAQAGTEDQPRVETRGYPMTETAIKTPSRDEVEEAMRDVVDPELGINVVDLGLVYDVHIDEDASVVLDMTLTSAACPLTDVIEDQTAAALTGGPRPVASGYTINWVWLPPWGPDKITEDGREQLRALGFNV